MRPFILLAAVAAGAACGGTDTNFHVAQEGRVDMRLGPVNQTCNLSSAATGVPNDDGSVTTFVHSTQGGDCVIRATWAGTLIDMAAVREEAEGEIHEASLSDTRINRFNLKIEAARLRDLANDAVLDVSDLSMKEIHAGVDVDDVRAMAVDFDTTQAFNDPDNPDEFVIDPEALAPVADEAFQAGEDLLATGDVEIIVDLDGVDGFQEADDPAYALEFQADFDGGGRDEE